MNRAATAFEDAVLRQSQRRAANRSHLTATATQKLQRRPEMLVPADAEFVATEYHEIVQLSQRIGQGAGLYRRVTTALHKTAVAGQYVNFQALPASVASVMQG